MTPEAFDRLVSEWLDSPTPELAQAIESAVARDPSLRALHDRSRRLAALLASHPPMPRVHWARFAEQVRAACDDVSGHASGDVEASSDAALDALLAQTNPASRVDWSRVARRISVAVDASSSQKQRARRRQRWLITAAASSLAAAAALAMAFLPHVTRSPAAASLVALAVSGPASNGPTASVTLRLSGPERVASPQTLFAIDPAPPRDGGAIDGLY